MNETDRAELPDGRDVVVRIARQGVPWFTDEARLMTRARAAGIPTPRQLGVEHLDDDDGLSSFCVQEFIPGRTLDVLAGELPVRELERLVMDVGEVLARIHDVAPDGGMGHDLRPPDEASMARVVQTVTRVVGASEVAVVERGVDVLHRAVAGPPVRSSAFVQGDFMPNNLVVDDGMIVGVIDWEFAGSAPPAFDFARWEVSAGDPWQDWSDVLRSGYSRVENPDVAAAGLVPVFALSWALEKLGWRNPATAAQIRRCVNIVNHYSAS